MMGTREVEHVIEGIHASVCVCIHRDPNPILGSKGKKGVSVKCWKKILHPWRKI